MTGRGRICLLILFAVVLVLGFGAIVSIVAKVDQAYCASGHHSDPCPGKYGSPWIYCGDPMASGVCMTATDEGVFLAGHTAFGVGLVGAFLAVPWRWEPPEEQQRCPTCGRPRA